MKPEVFMSGDLGGWAILVHLITNYKTLYIIDKTEICQNEKGNKKISYFFLLETDLCNSEVLLTFLYYLHLKITVITVILIYS